jgi:AcrR family transcriptional regulator/DNA-binding MarR family transcriptional regulator
MSVTNGDVRLAARTYKHPRRLPRGSVSAAQRARIIAAMIDVAYERGLESVALAQIVARADVSTRTFYELFEDRSDCLLAAMEQTLEFAGERLGTAYASGERWLDQVRAGLLEMLSLFDEDPRLAWLLVVHSAGAGPAALTLRAQVLDRLASALDEGRADAPSEPLPLTAQAVVGGVVSVIHSRLLAPDTGMLLDLLNPLMSMIALPYRGAGTARDELARRRATPSHNARSALSSRALVGYDIRLTSRTLAVLRVIAAEPGLSNRQIGDRAGIADRGQASRLLARLCERKLIENTGGGQPLGAANAWQLTPRGRRLAFALGRESDTGRRFPAAGV